VGRGRSPQGKLREGRVGRPCGAEFALEKRKALQKESAEGLVAESALAAPQRCVALAAPGAGQREVGVEGLARRPSGDSLQAHRRAHVELEQAQSLQVSVELGKEETRRVGPAEATRPSQAQARGGVACAHRAKRVDKAGHVGRRCFAEEGQRQVELAGAHPAGLGGGAPGGGERQEEGGLQAVRQWSGKEETHVWSSAWRAKHCPGARLQG
jgi:hypothetical protein